MTGTIVLWAVVGVLVRGAIILVWKLWSGQQAGKQYAQGKATAGADVHQALQGKSFIVGTPSDFIEGDLRGHFRWLSSERAWGLRLDNSKTSLRSLEGISFPLWVVQAPGDTWVLHQDGKVPLKAYNTDVSFVFPKSLKEGDQIRLGDDAKDSV